MPERPSLPCAESRHTMQDKIDSLDEAMGRAYEAKGSKDMEPVAAGIVRELERMGWTLWPRGGVE